MFCIVNFPANNLNFHCTWKDRIQAIFLNLFYFTDYWFKTIFHPYFFRTQNLYCWSGQCRKNDDIVSVPYERSCTHITHHWFKCWRGGMEKRTLYHVGPGRSRISTRRLEHLLLKHRSELYTYIKVRWLQGRTWHIKITTITKKSKSYSFLQCSSGPFNDKKRSKNAYLLFPT